MKSLLLWLLKESLKRIVLYLGEIILLKLGGKITMWTKRKFFPKIYRWAKNSPQRNSKLDERLLDLMETDEDKKLSIVDKEIEELIEEKKEKGKPSAIKDIKQCIEELLPLFQTKFDDRLEWCFYSVLYRLRNKKIDLPEIANLYDKLEFLYNAIDDLTNPKEAIRELVDIIKVLEKPMEILNKEIKKTKWKNSNLEYKYNLLKDSYLEIAVKLDKIQRELPIKQYRFKKLFPNN